ncbi:MAG TPA: sulfatase-like hydrolase/transferase, partial [Vicinamibacterales bacterium]
DTDGLTDDTIIFFISDHGAGMPRSKRFPYNSGLNVPILIVIPEKFRHVAPTDYEAGGRSKRLIGHIDLAPSLLSAAGVPAPSFYQGEAYMGPRQTAPRQYSFGFRGRMDERYDLIRTVRDQRYVYLRNYYPHKVYGQYINYMWGTPTTKIWEQLYKAGRLKPPQTYFWETKPPEELYDLETDHDEVHNLASDPRRRGVLERMREVHRRHELDVRDIGLLTEAEFQQRARDANATPYEVAQDRTQYHVENVLAAAVLASSGAPGQVDRLRKMLDDSDSGVRYWAATGLLIRGAAAVKAARRELVRALEDASHSVRIAAAEALGRYGTDDDIARVMPVLLALANPVETNSYVAILALNAISALGDKAKPFKAQIVALPRVDEKSPSRVNREYTTNLLNRLTEVL